MLAGCRVDAAPTIDPPPVRTPLSTMIAPPAMTAVPAFRSLAGVGEVYYRHYCTDCHGAAGSGDGPGAALLDPRPTDFRDPAYMRRQTPGWYYHAITDGVVGSSMAPWEQRLMVEERWDTAFYAWSLATAPDELRRGAEVYADRCARCHGSDGGGVASARLNDPRRVAQSRADVAAALAAAHPDLAGGPTADRDAVVEHVWTFLYAPVDAPASDPMER